MNITIEIYIVRIYRRDKKYPHGFIGMVEEASSGAENSFHSLEELGRILCGGRQSRKEKNGVPIINKEEDR